MQHMTISTADIGASARTHTHAPNKRLMGNAFALISTGLSCWNKDEMLAEMKFV